VPTGGISGSGITISGLYVCRVYRDATSGDDDYNRDAGLLFVDFHIEMDSVGSKTEMAK